MHRNPPRLARTNKRIGAAVEPQSTLPHHA
jgi:hypothetical protein